MSNKLLLDEQPLVILPQLATAIGLNEAVVIQQIHYWLGRPTVGKMHEGRKWMRNTYAQWKENFPFWGERTIKRTIKSLREKGLIKVENLNKAKYDRTNWYTINYDKLDELSDRECQSDTMESDKMAKPIPETTAENTLETADAVSSPPAETPIKRKATGRNAIKVELEQHFADTTGLAKPATDNVKQRKAASALWWKPLLEIHDCSGSLEGAVALIDWAVGELDGRGMSISSPRSILKTAIAEQARRKRSNGAPRPSGRANGCGQSNVEKSMQAAQRVIDAVDRGEYGDDQRVG